MKTKVILILILSAAGIHCYGQYNASDQAAVYYANQEYDKSYPMYRAIVSKSNADMIDLFIYAEHLYYGFGVQVDRRKAEKYYKKSADLGFYLATTRVCDILYNRRASATKKDYKDMYKYSHDYGINSDYPDSNGIEESNARYLLYLCYANGWGVEQNHQLADVWMAYGAYNESIPLENLMCEKYHLKDDYDSEDDMRQYYSSFFNILYSLIEPFVYNDFIPDQIFRFHHIMANRSKSNIVNRSREALNILMEAYDNPKLPRSGKAFVLDYIVALNRYLGNYIEAETYSKVYEEYYVDVSDEDKDAWVYYQFQSLIKRVDTALLY